MKTILWKPNETQTKKTYMYCFMQQVNQQHDLSLQNYNDLYQWSIDNPEQFWQEVWHYCGIKCSTPPQKTVTNFNKMPGAIWFPGAQLNFAEHLLARRDQQIAIRAFDENGERITLTYADLYTEVARLANALRQQGIKTGDRIAAYLPNSPETIIAMLACASIGAIWSCCSPDFGLRAVLDRFSQIQPKVLFTVAEQQYRGKQHDLTDKVTKLIDALPSLQQVVLIPRYDKQKTSAIKNTILWQDFLSEQTELEFTPLPFDHPLYIMYSSGTTGVPKCIVHGAGNILIQHLKELMLHVDLHEHDTIFYYTTCGWMMWNWLVSSLAMGATVVLYEGAPDFPDPNALFDLIDKASISVFGISAKFLTMAEKAHLKPIDTHRLQQLRCILSTGSPLAPESFDYAYQYIKTDMMLCSISGGTDIVSCFALGNPLSPIHRGELQCRGLGMAVAVFNEQGQAVKQERGELVCHQAFPCMPLYFWNDNDGKKYHAAYFEKFKGIWAHGDYAMITKHNGIVIYGRSDAVLNPGGVRIGSAEIYRQVEKIDDVLESIAIDQQWQDDTRIILFVKLRDDLQLDDQLIQDIKKVIRNNATPRHVPAKILQVNDIPRTLNGKIVELAVRNVVHNRPISNKETLANPEALEQFANRKELK